MQHDGLRYTAWLSGLLLLIGWPGYLHARSVRHSPCKADAAHHGWRVYVNSEFQFCLRYPPTYHEEPAPSPDEFPGMRRLAGTLAWSRLPPDTHGSPVDNTAGIAFVSIPRSFSLQELQTCCAPMGLDDTPPQEMHFGGRAFYFYGPGGGGVDYADQYLMEIKGQILSIQFLGPWKDGRSPIDQTKMLEPEILSTLQTW